jgi:hypothetical protein
LLNCFTFEKNLAKADDKRKKFVSVCDYEIVDNATNLGMNYGFFASSLDNEDKGVIFYKLYNILYLLFINLGENIYFKFNK